MVFDQNIYVLVADQFLNHTDNVKSNSWTEFCRKFTLRNMMGSASSVLLQQRQRRVHGEPGSQGLCALMARVPRVLDARCVSGKADSFENGRA